MIMCSITCIDQRYWYTKNIHFGWMKEKKEDIVANYPKTKVQLAMEWTGREIRFNDYGSRTIDSPLRSTIDTIIPDE